MNWFHVLWDDKDNSLLTSVREWDLRRYLTYVIKPFLSKFWFDIQTDNWNKNYLLFQKILLIVFPYLEQNEIYDYSRMETVLQNRWYELVGQKKLALSIDLMNDTIKSYKEESWDNFDMKEFLQKAQSWELYFWFLPLEWKKTLIVFARKKTIEIDSSVLKIWHAKTEVKDWVEETLWKHWGSENLPEIDFSGWVPTGFEKISL